MENRKNTQLLDPTMQAEVVRPKIGAEQLRTFTLILQKYRAGKVQTEQRIQVSENWWKLRNSAEERSDSKEAGLEGFKSASGWLHNVIVSKHADAMKAFPEPNILPRESDDKAEASMLSAIIPCVLEQNNFEDTYSKAVWQKLKTGTGVYKVVWDTSKLNGLGDIHVEQVNLLNIYWEPGVTDIQRSRYFFHTEMWDKDVLEERYPQLKDKLKGQGFVSAKFLYDDHVNTEDKHTVIDVYYKRYVNGKQVLHYCKYVGEEVIYATENDTQPIMDAVGNAKPPLAETGLYDHGKYPYFFDSLFPIEGSPCGYGFVDLCRNPQTAIDMLNTAMIKNAQVGAAPRYFSRIDGNINEEEFLDTTKPIVHVNGNVDEASIRRIEHNSLDGMYVNLLTNTIQELRETSSNTEAATGATPGSVTAASGIAALQEAAGKTSSDSTQASYRVFSQMVDMCIELIRQFYDLPRKFRILGQYGAERYVTYTNQGIQPQYQGNAFGQDMGFRLPVFDIKVSAQKKSTYTKLANNELALQFFKMGFFNPTNTDQSLMCIGMMDFDGKDAIMQQIAQMGTMHKKLLEYMQLALSLAQAIDPGLAQKVAQDIIVVNGGTPPAMADTSPNIAESNNITGIQKEEHAVVRNARQQSNDATQPDADGVMMARK